MTDEPELLLETRGLIGLMTLNKPKALNALSMTMVEDMHPQIVTWANDNTIGAVVIQGAGEKAFCAGGDIRDMYLNRGTDFGAVYYAAEYLLNVGIHTFPKPFIALMDGVTMGGGAGVSIHGSHRVVTERTLFAMPETGIGLFPDIGASWFLSCCPGQIGMYLGLTGHRMRAADCLYAGIGDFYIESTRQEELLVALSGATEIDERSVNRVLKSFATEPGLSPLAKHREAIDRCFAGDSVTEILENLENEDTDWAREQLEVLEYKSPTALKLTYRQLSLAPKVDSIADIMRMEYRMAFRIYRGNDLFEGIRAVVIDKDGVPKWQPDSLDAVSDADIDEYFVPVSDEPDFSQAELS
ncbi:MAG: enoyl-CoA hydratase/isomerase family protein [Alphaproteobacteria bacterium]|nr:enoyl-CoA hydratase/isomerase family protein [Alphaproteobacteria bacterium]